MYQQIDFTVRDALAASNGTFSGDCSLLNEKFTAAAIDSRKVIPGGMFIAIKGEKADGYDYIPSAIEKGALCAVCDRAQEGYPCIVVNDPVTALQDIARSYRSKLNITLSQDIKSLPIGRLFMFVQVEGVSETDMHVALALNTKRRL